MGGRSGLVDRGGELAALRKALADAARGQGSVLLLAGESGIGKTRLAEELAAEAAAAGAGVAWGRCHAGDWWPPYGPWVEAGLAAADDDRFALYDRVVQALSSAAETATFVLVLDDLHNADASSLALLQYVARFVGTLPVLVVGTYCEDVLELTHPLATCLTDLRRERLLHRVPVGPLDADATAALLAAIVGGAVPDATVEAIHAQTAGNPFFVEEVVRHLRAEGWDLTSPIDGLGLPDIPASVRETVGSRVARLSPETLRTLSLASAFSGAFEFVALEVLTGLPEDDLLDCVDEALHASLLASDGGDAYTFAHALVRQTLYENLSPSRRARLHRRIVRALEEVHAGRELEVAGELAHQYHRSRSLPGAAHGIAYARAAADRWPEVRQRFLEIARDLGDESPPSADDDGLTARERQVLALLAAGSSNKDIARELVVSDHTVERHVANIYRKIGARNRSGATAWAIAHGVPS